MLPKSVTEISLTHFSINALNAYKVFKLSSWYWENDLNHTLQHHRDTNYYDLIFIINTGNLFWPTYHVYEQRRDLAGLDKLCS